MTIWYKGISDQVLAKFQAWRSAYDHGDVHSTRKFLTKRGVLEDRVVKRAHQIGWSASELAEAVRLLGSSEEGRTYAEEFKAVQKIWSKGQPVPGGRRLVTLAFYQEHVNQMCDLLMRVKDQETHQSIEERIQQAKEGGTDLFEIP